MMLVSVEQQMHHYTEYPEKQKEKEIRFTDESYKRGRYEKYRTEIYRNIHI